MQKMSLTCSTRWHVSREKAVIIVFSVVRTFVSTVLFAKFPLCRPLAAVFHCITVNQPPPSLYRQHYCAVWYVCTVCTWIAQDRAHLTQVLSRWPIVPYPSGHWLLFRAPLWGLALSIGMADSASSAEDSPDDDSDLSRMRTDTGHKKLPDDNSDLGRTRTATGHRKRSSSQTAVQREEGLAAERLLHIPFHIHHQLTEYTFTHFAYPFFVITHLSNLWIAAWLSVRHVFAHCVCLVFITYCCL